MATARRTMRGASPREEARRFLSWAAIGVVNTLVHVGVVVALVEGFSCGPVVANGLAFVAASTFSFFANSHWSFRVPPTRGHYFRFLVVSVVGLAASLACSALAKAMQWHYLLGVLCTLVLLPLCSFALHRLWTWRELPR